MGNSHYMEWSEAEWNLVRRLKAERFTNEEIAGVLGCSKGTVQRRTRDAGIERPLATNKHAEYQREYWRHLHGMQPKRMWLPEDDEKLTRLFYEGYRDEMISYKTGWSYRQVKRRRVVLGLTVWRLSRDMKNGNLERANFAVAKLG